MNENVKTYLRIAGGFIVVAILVYAVWFLFRSDVSDHGTTANDVTEQLDTVDSEQRAAQNSLESVQSGLDDSQRTVDKLDESTRNAQSAADGISESNTNIANAVNDAKTANSSSAAIIAHSERRIADCQSIIQDVRKTAGTVTENH